MYTAKEARERALDIANEKYQKQIEAVTEAINKAVEKSELETTVFYQLYDSVSIELRQLNYIIENKYDSQDQCYHTIISW